MPEYSAVCNHFAMEMPTAAYRKQQNPAGKGSFRSVFRILRQLFDVIKLVQHQPELRKIPHDVPDTHTAQLIFTRKQQLGLHRARILEPDLVLGAFPPIVIVRRLRDCVKADGRAHLYRLLGRLHVAERPRAALAFDVGQRPVVASKLYNRKAALPGGFSSFRTSATT